MLTPTLKAVCADSDKGEAVHAGPGFDPGDTEPDADADADADEDGNVGVGVTCMHDVE